MVHSIKVPFACLFSYKCNLESAGKICFIDFFFFLILASNKIFKLYWVVLANISCILVTCLAMKIQTKTRNIYLVAFCYNWKMKTHFCEEITLEERYVYILKLICAHCFSMKSIPHQSCNICRGSFGLLVCRQQKV